MGLGLDNPVHWAILVVVLLLVFGARRLPEIGRSIGSGMREFKEGISSESRPALPEQKAAEGPAPAAPQETQQAPVETPTGPRA